MAGEFWFQLFSCVAEQEQEQRRRPRIDRSMIGQPMDFRHTGHVGSSDLGSIGSLQTQMRGKGGESINIQVPHILNARSIHDIQRHSIKAWLPTMYSSHTIKARPQLFRQGMTPATLSRHDSKYSYQHYSSHSIKAGLQSLHKGMTRPITPAKHYLTTPSRYYSKALFIGLSQAITSRHSSKSPSRHDLYPSFKQLLYLLETNQPVQKKWIYWSSNHSIKFKSFKRWYFL